MIEVQTKPAPVEVVTPIKPSEAIRLGCLIAPVQTFNEAFVSMDGRGACAYGAMALGMRGRDRAEDRAMDLLMGGFRRADVGDCPECGTRSADPIHLNDDHRWSRERIASWLESIGL